MLRDLGVDSLVGIDVSERAMRVAQECYNHVVCSPVETVNLTDLGDTRFDTIVAADVLEHLVDPWRELQRWRDWLVPGGELVISVPNLRDLRVLMGLAIRGRFDYSDHGGVMDRTHLRWFTAASMTDELRSAGWTVERRGGNCGPWRGRLNRLTRRRFEDVLAFQLHLAAR
jgi:2-polyprenyl-3-methyl-5-hydroxy-6-metoxy-1,4-benzoquinol methylase